MVSGEARKVLIVRRMKRKSLGIWAWNVYDPTKASSDELKFTLLDENERSIGQLAFTKFATIRAKETLLNTPWGEGRIESVKGGVRLVLSGRELATVKVGLFRKELELMFPNSVGMVFRPIKGHKNDIEYSDGKGSVAVFEEKGSLPEGKPSPGPQMTKDEIKMLPKDQRPRSIETRDYVQYRIVTTGIISAKQEDIVAALSIFASLGCIAGEITA